MSNSAVTIAVRPESRYSISTGEMFRNTSRTRSTPNESTNTTNAPNTAPAAAPVTAPNVAAWAVDRSTTSPATTRERVVA